MNRSNKIVFFQELFISFLHIIKKLLEKENLKTSVLLKNNQPTPQCLDKRSSLH